MNLAFIWDWCIFNNQKNDFHRVDHSHKMKFLFINRLKPTLKLIPMKYKSFSMAFKAILLIIFLWTVTSIQYLSLATIVNSTSYTAQSEKIFTTKSNNTKNQLKTVIADKIMKYWTETPNMKSISYVPKSSKIAHPMKKIKVNYPTIEVRLIDHNKNT